MADPVTGQKRLEAANARQRLLATLEELMDRLSPQTLASAAWQGAMEKGSAVAGGAVTGVINRPVLTGAVAAGIMLFLFRRPVADWAGELKQSLGKQRPSAAAAQQQGD